MKKNYKCSSEQLEEVIAKQFDFSHCVLTGRATSGFTAIFNVLFNKNDRVIFPAIICPQPIVSAKIANLTPVIIDVQKNNGIIDIEKVKNALEKDKKIKAIVFVELFGQQKEKTLQKLILLAKKHQVFLIRDCAQSLPVQKSESDFTILSFGHTKILDCGHAGAILTNNRHHSNSLREKIQSFKKFNRDSFYKNALLYRKKFYSIKRKQLNDNEETECLNQLLLKQADFYNLVFCDNYIDSLYLKLSEANNIIDKRRELSNLYYNALIDKNLKVITNPHDDVPWRFSILLRNNNIQKTITSKLRAHNFHASNWYESVIKYFRHEEVITYEIPKNSLNFEQRVLNLWIDDSRSIEYTNDCINFLVQTLDMEE